MFRKLSFTIDEAVESSGIPRTKLYAALNEGRLKARKDGRTTVILGSELQRYLESLPLAPHARGDGHQAAA